MSKFSRVFHHAGHLCRIWVAWKDGQPVASIITLTLGRNTNYWRGAMNAALAGPTRANYLLHRLAIEDACRAGAERYHMGETGSSESLAQFKSRFGARRVDYVELRVERLPLTLARFRAGAALDAGQRVVRGHRSGRRA